MVDEEGAMETEMRESEGETEEQREREGGLMHLFTCIEWRKTKSSFWKRTD